MTDEQKILIAQFYSSVLYRGFRESDEGGYINTKIIPAKGRIQEAFFTTEEEMLSYILDDKAQCYHGITVKSRKTGKGEAAMYSNVLVMDIDFHGDQYKNPDVMEGMKKKAVQEAADDPAMSQCAALIDTGRGLHFYFLLPKKIWSTEFRTFEDNLLTYALGLPFISQHLDMKVKDTARVLRCPGTLNLATGTYAEIVYLDPEPVDQNFMEYIKKRTRQQKPRASVKRAMELCGIAAEPNLNTPCPFPGHGSEDKSPSFRYYDDSDTFWCFKCSPETDERGTMYDGFHFLQLMEKPELIPTLQAEMDVQGFDPFTLTPEGKMYKSNKDGVKILVADFLSSCRIEAELAGLGRRAYIDLDTIAVDISDFPPNRELKRRYFSAHKDFILNGADSGLADIVARWIQKSVLSDRRIAQNYGINTGYEAPFFYLNNIAYPSGDDTVIPIMEPMTTKRSYDEQMTLNTLFKLLVMDNNHSHIIGMLWAVASTARDIIINKAGMFPMLVATGIRESGKTLLGRLITSMFGYDSLEELDTTPFAMIKKIERYGTLPIHFDEFGAKKREQEHDEILKDICTSVVAVKERGNTSKGTDKYALMAPVIITGEKNILDAGIVSRSIILNLGRNGAHNDEAFTEWMKCITDSALSQFFDKWLRSHWESYREYIANFKFSRSRDILKSQIVFTTLDYLQSNGILGADSVHRPKLAELLEYNDFYKASVSPDAYTEMLNEVFTDRFDPTIDVSTNLRYIKMLDSLYYSVADGAVVFSVPAFWEFYKDMTKTAYRKVRSVSELKVVFGQSPDFISEWRRGCKAVIGPENDKKISLYPAVIIKVSDFNIDFLRVPLMYKLRKYFPGKDYEEAADALLKDMKLATIKDFDNMCIL